MPVTIRAACRTLLGFSGLYLPSAHRLENLLLAAHDVTLWPTPFRPEVQRDVVAVGSGLHASGSQEHYHGAHANGIVLVVLRRLLATRQRKGCSPSTSLETSLRLGDELLKLLCFQLLELLAGPRDTQALSSSAGGAGCLATIHIGIDIN